LTDWSAEQRLASRTPLPLNAEGLKQGLAWANELAGRDLSTVCCGDEPNSRRVAELVADRAEVRLRPMEELREVDVGLWEGLTPAQIEERYPRIYRRWLEDPTAASPPEAEPFADAVERIRGGLDRIIRKHRDHAVAVVLGPLALAVARCHLEHAEVSELHRFRPSQPDLGIAGSEAPIWYKLTGEADPPAQPATDG